MVSASRKPAKKAAPLPKKPRTARSHHYHVYVIELSDEVWNAARFRRANPDWQLGKPFVYVGMTGLDPDVRFDKHKAGIQANVYVQKWGLRLLPQPGPVNAIFANANGVKTVPIKARDDAQPGRLG